MNIVNNLEWLKKLEEEVSDNKSKYDIVVPISGGKDGAFLLWYICKHTNLRVLAYHIDNWFVSESAENNVKKLCAELECDCEFIRPDWGALKDIYRELLRKNGEICIACEMMISLYPIEAAITKEIPYIVWGLTPTQISAKKICSGVKEIDYKYYKKISDYYSKLIDVIFEDEERAKSIKRKLLDNKIINNEKKYPKFVMPFYYLGYDAGKIETLVRNNTSWTRPNDVGGTSSNCIINQLHIYLKKKIKGEDFYRKMMENKYNSGEVTKQVMEYALNDSENLSTVEDLMKMLDLDESIEELIANIRGANKHLFLKLESNISQ